MNLVTSRQVGRFELKRELGRGAQATVWLAHDPRLDRDVALKLLDPTADTVAVSQWLHEARAVSRLTHPHIVPVFEADEQPGQPYLVFEYVPGQTLAEALRHRGAMPAREAVALMVGVLDALAAAHAQGIVHRDLKPSNILLGSDGFVDKLKPLLSDYQMLKEVPRRERLAARPSLEELFADVHDKAERDHGIHDAVRAHEYTLQAVADHLGLHSSTISTIAKRVAGRAKTRREEVAPRPSLPRSAR